MDAKKASDSVGQGCSSEKEPSKKKSPPPEEIEFANRMTINQEQIERLRELKKLQLHYTYLESEFYKEFHALKCKYSERYSVIYKKRYEIIAGQTSTAEGEGHGPSDSEKQCGAMAMNVPGSLHVSNRSGVPGFWLSVLKKSSHLVARTIEKHDEPLLMHLMNISVKYTLPMGFVLEFCFKPNPYFTNDLLTKEYWMTCEVKEDEPSKFDGPMISRCRGCHINWNEGMNLTDKSVLEKQKSEGKDVDDTESSFFSFFQPICESAEELDREIVQHLRFDFLTGRFMRDSVVPHAFWHYIVADSNGPGRRNEDQEQGAERDEEEKDVHHDIQDENK